MEGNRQKGVWLAEFDLTTLRDYRAREVHGNAFRRPWKYGLLTDEHIDPPFIRAENQKIR